MTMNLSGSLDAFGLDEVLALLGMGGRTARMQVTSPAGVGSIQLVDGEVSAASADCTRAGLLRQVVAAVPVPVSDLVRALEEVDPVRALVDSGAVDRDQAQEVSAEHLVDALGEMLAWGQGEFAVWAGEADPGDIGTRVPVDEAVARAQARAAEWERVRGQLPDPDSVLALSPSVDQPPTLALDDWSMLARIDGRRTLAEVLAVAGCAPLAASDRMVDLLGRGLVEVRAGEAVEAVDEVNQLLDAYEAPEPAVMAPIEVVAPELEGEPEQQLEAAAPLIEAEVGDAVPTTDSVVVVWPAGSGSEVGEHAPVEWGEPEAAGWVEEQPVEATGWSEPEVAEWVESAQVVTWVEPEAHAEPVTWVEPEVAAESVTWVEPEVAAESVTWVEPEVAAESVTWLDSDDDAQQEPSTYVLVDPVPAQPAPAAATEPIAAAVEWSPWAQALGLGAPAPAGELAVDPLAGPGIAQMIAHATGMTETTEIPVPLAPVAWEADDAATDPAPPAPADPATEPFSAQPAEQLIAPLEAAQVVPAPRAPEDGQWVATTEVPVDPVEVAPAEQPAPVPAVAPAAAAGQDPLAGGLLSHLIDSVRGL